MSGKNPSTDNGDMTETYSLGHTDAWTEECKTQSLAPISQAADA